MNDSENSGTATETCSCATISGDSTGEQTARWITDSPAVEATLPEDLQVRLERMVGQDSVETLDEWAAEIKQQTDGAGINIDDLCHADEETGHRGTMDGETYHFLCFYDAVVLSALADQPVDIRTESPDGAVIEVQAEGTTDLRVTPEEAVFSFGVDEDVEPPEDGELSPEEMYAAVCPYVKAFPNPKAYEEWASEVPAATVALPLDGSTEFAAALVR